MIPRQGWAGRRLATALCVAALPLMAAFRAPPSGDDPVRGELLPVSAERTGELRIAVRLTIAPGWHIYWTNPGDAGLPSRIRWSLPPGVILRDVEWPAPRRFGRDSASLGYEREVVVIATVERRPGTEARPILIGAQVEWAACADVCVTGRTDLRAILPEGETSRRTREAVLRLADSSHGWTAEAVAIPDAVELRLTAPPGQTFVALDFFPAQPGEFNHRPPAVRRSHHGAIVRIPLAGGGAPYPGTLRGVLTWVDATGRRSAIAIMTRVAAPAKRETTAGTTPPKGATAVGAAPRAK